MENQNQPPGREESEKKIKNLISIVILLLGLFVGSLFIDVSQIIWGKGFSQKNLGKTDVFQFDGKTWVAFKDPVVTVKTLTDDKCEKCDPAEALVWLRRVLPTINAQKVGADSEEGKKLIEKYALKTLPSFVFSPEVEKTDFYAQAAMLFQKTDFGYLLKNEELGLPVGKYLSLPQAKEGDAVSGKTDAKVKVFVFSDFQCPYCQLFHKSLREAMKKYPDDVLFVFKHLPLSIHNRAADAALASECALEQGKFWEYSDLLFGSQKEWSSVSDNGKFKEYARRLGMDSGKFNQCLDEKKYQSRVDENAKEAAEFGISGTPGIFINDQFNGGVMSVDELNQTIESELKK